MFLPDIDEDERRHWHTGEMRWGLFKERQVSCFVLDNGQGMVMSAAFNIWEMTGRKLARWLLDGDVTTIRLLLAERHTSAIVACREITAGQDISAQIKKYLHEQYMRYDSKLAACTELEKLEKKYDPDTMLAIAAGRHSCWLLPSDPAIFRNI